MQCHKMPNTVNEPHLKRKYIWRGEVTTFEVVLSSTPLDSELNLPLMISAPVLPLRVLIAPPFQALRRWQKNATHCDGHSSASGALSPSGVWLTRLLVGFLISMHYSAVALTAVAFSRSHTERTPNWP